MTQSITQPQYEEYSTYCAALAKVKFHPDLHMFLPIRVSVTATRNGANDFMAKHNKMFEERRDVVVKKLKPTVYTGTRPPSGASQAKT